MSDETEEGDFEGADPRDQAEWVDEMQGNDLED